MKKCLIAVGMAAWTLGPSGALGQVYSDWLRVYNEKGVVVSEATLTEDQENRLVDGLTTLQTVPNVAPDVTQVLNQTAVTERNGFVSDFFGVYVQAGRFVLGFYSDGEQLVPFTPDKFTTVVPESGTGVLDATKYLDPALRANGYTAKFWSDVPDGGPTAGLLGLGLTALALGSRHAKSLAHGADLRLEG